MYRPNDGMNGFRHPVAVSAATFTKYLCSRKQYIDINYMALLDSELDVQKFLYGPYLRAEFSGCNEG